MIAALGARRPSVVAVSRPDKAGLLRRVGSSSLDELVDDAGTPGLLALLLAAAQVVPLLARHRYPWLSAALVGAAFLVRQMLPVPRSPADLALVVALLVAGPLAVGWRWGRSRQQHRRDRRRIEQLEHRLDSPRRPRAHQRARPTWTC